MVSAAPPPQRSACRGAVARERARRAAFHHACRGGGGAPPAGCARSRQPRAGSPSPPRGRSARAAASRHQPENAMAASRVRTPRRSAWFAARTPERATKRSRHCPKRTQRSLVWRVGKERGAAVLRALLPREALRAGGGAPLPTKLPLTTMLTHEQVNAV
jgi:hypothetical protein